MRRALIAVALLLGLPLWVAACLWDRDTPADEAKGMPEIVAVLTGRFERNPPLYYEMHSGRVTAEIQTHPEDLAAYDDAGVACDRLGRGDEAISWMEKKRDQLEKLDASRPEVKDHQYRYHANLGTFLVHRWLRQGAERTKIDEVKAAHDEIARAIEINPNAHYGREKYQLHVLEWIVDPPKAAGLSYLPNLLGRNFEDREGGKTTPLEADDAVRGLAGLVVLGNAWESVDVFHALNLALQRDSLGYPESVDGGRNSLAYLALERGRELTDAGKGSMLPDAPKGNDLKALLPRGEYGSGLEMIESSFEKLRAEADAWHAARSAFMMRKLEQGLHPDTHPDFWSGYTEPPAPELPTETVNIAPGGRGNARRQRVGRLIVGILALGLVAGLTAIRLVKARRRKSRLPGGGLSDSSDGFR